VNVIAPILTRGDEMVLQTIFYPIEMFAKRRDGTSLRIAIDGPGFESKNFGHAKYLDASAILNGKQLNVFASNRSLEESMDLAIRLGNAQIGRLVNGEIVSGKDPKASNTFENPNEVVSTPFKDAMISNGVATLKLPPLSVVAATFDLA
jgi:alpha-N-arabinofuranosidase